MYWDRFGYDVMVLKCFMLWKIWLFGLILIVLLIRVFIVRVKSIIYLLYKIVNFVDEGSVFVIFCLKWIESFLKKLKGFLNIMYWMFVFMILK